MNTANIECLIYLTTLIMFFDVNATSPPIPLLDEDNNATTNNTETSRLLNNVHVSGSVATGCFSSDTLVTLDNQQQIPIGQLRSGRQLLTIDHTNIVNTEMMMMLDQNQLSSAMFHTIFTASGHKVSLTGLHLIATVTNEDEIEYKSAKDVKQGDILRVMSNGEVYSSVVNNVTIEVKRGFYAPLTLTGTLLVNGVVASCFSNVESHEMVQFYLNPLRWYYRMSRWLSIDKPFGDEIGDGMHSIAQILYELVQSVHPSILRLV